MQNGLNWKQIKGGGKSALHAILLLHMKGVIVPLVPPDLKTTTTTPTLKKIKKKDSGPTNNSCVLPFSHELTLCTLCLYYHTVNAQEQ